MCTYRAGTLAADASGNAFAVARDARSALQGTTPAGAGATARCARQESARLRRSHAARCQPQPDRSHRAAGGSGGAPERGAPCARRGGRCAAPPGRRQAICVAAVPHGAESRAPMSLLPAGGHSNPIRGAVGHPAHRPGPSGRRRSSARGRAGPDPHRDRCRAGATGARASSAVSPGSWKNQRRIRGRVSRDHGRRRPRRRSHRAILRVDPARR